VSQPNALLLSCICLLSLACGSDNDAMPISPETEPDALDPDPLRYLCDTITESVPCPAPSRWIGLNLSVMDLPLSQMC